MKSWEDFFSEKTKEIFKHAKLVIDIGGGLRIDKNRNNRYDVSREWLIPLIKNVDYKILDTVDTYHPDIVGDIHHLPLDDNSVDAIFCISVLEHVEDPFQAISEIWRVLKSGGYCLAYVPFLYYYHAEDGYYKDYWRFSHDAIDLLFKKFSIVEKHLVRGAIESWFRLSPLGRYSIFTKLAKMLDIITGKNTTKQTSGYYIFLIK